MARCRPTGGVIETKPHIAVVDDDRSIRDPLARYLTKAGYRVSTAADAVEFEKLLVGATIDVAILDIMMPGEDGLSVCRRLMSGRRTPVILLTALAEETDRIVGLELGADDYVCKPFNPRELLARIRSVLRRAEMLPPRQTRLKGSVRFDRWIFNYARKEVVGPAGVAVRLSTAEHMLLTALIDHAGVVLTRDQLLDITRGRDAEPFDRSVDTQISRLRRKLEIDSRSPQIILTEWGGGYVFGADLEWLA